MFYFFITIYCKNVVEMLSVYCQWILKIFSKYSFVIKKWNQGKERKCHLRFTIQLHLICESAISGFRDITGPPTSPYLTVRSGGKTRQVNLPDGRRVRCGLGVAESKGTPTPCIKTTIYNSISRHYNRIHTEFFHGYRINQPSARYQIRTTWYSTRWQKAYSSLKVRGQDYSATWSYIQIQKLLEYYTYDYYWMISHRNFVSDSCIVFL